MTPDQGDANAMPDDAIAYFEVDPPADRHLQCACEHTLRSSNLLNTNPAEGRRHRSNKIEEDDTASDEDMYTLRCTKLVCL